MSICEDRDGLHIYKGKAVYAVRGYPAECMECGATIPYAPEMDEKAEDNTVIYVEKVGTNPDQRPIASMYGPTATMGDVKIGDVFHISGQPSDVKWRVTKIIPPQTMARR